jgi:hypothetical protein
VRLRHDVVEHREEGPVKLLAPRGLHGQAPHTNKGCVSMASPWPQRRPPTPQRHLRVGQIEAVRVDGVRLCVHIVCRDGTVRRRRGVRRERDNAFDGREGELDGVVVPERGVATQTLPDASN